MPAVGVNSFVCFLLVAVVFCVYQYSEGDLMAEEECRNCKVPVQVLHQLHKDLQTRRKCFSGAQLVTWIMRNADLFLSSDELSLCGGYTSIGVQGASAIAQQLLDLHLIIDVEAENACEFTQCGLGLVAWCCVTAV